MLNEGANGGAGVLARRSFRKPEQAVDAQVRRQGD
jgi:hypothetical protein